MSRLPSMGAPSSTWVSAVESSRRWPRGSEGHVRVGVPEVGACLSARCIRKGVLRGPGAERTRSRRSRANADGTSTRCRLVSRMAHGPLPRVMPARAGNTSETKASQFLPLAFLRPRFGAPGDVPWDLPRPGGPRYVARAFGVVPTLVFTSPVARNGRVEGVGAWKSPHHPNRAVPGREWSTDR